MLWKLHALYTDMHASQEDKDDQRTSEKGITISVQFRSVMFTVA